MLRTVSKHPYMLTVVCSLLYYLSYYNYGIDLDDEGFFLLGASSILDGRWPMADYFSYQPLSYFILAGFYKLFGNGVHAERILLLAIIVSNNLILLMLSRKVLNGMWSLLPVMAYGFAPGPWYKVFFIADIIWVVGVIAIYLKYRNYSSALLVGGVIGVALITRYEAGLIGGVLALGVYALIVIDKISNKEYWLDEVGKLLISASAAFCVVGAMLLMYLAFGKWGELKHNFLVYYWYSDTSSLMHDMGIVDRFSVSSLIINPSAEQWFYAAGLLATLYLLARDAVSLLLKSLDTRVILRLIISAAALGTLSYSYLFVWNSRMLSTFPFIYIVWSIICADFSKWVLLNGKNKTLLIFPTAYILVISVAIIWFCRIQNYSGSLSARLPATVQINHPRLMGINIYADQQDDIARMMEYMDKPEGYLVSMSESTTMSYLSLRDNPTYYYLFTTEFAGQGEPERALRVFDQLCIDFFIARRRQFRDEEGLGSDLSAYAPIVKDFLVSRYSVKDLGDKFVLLKRSTSCE